ncbi:MAG: glutathione S-transferase [Paracoccaceae bacterium]
MTDYTLHYWPAPFRGEFVRAVLAHVGADWSEAGSEKTARAMSLPVAEQQVPHMAPPMLVDHGADVALAQMPAILAYLGVKHGLMPEDSTRNALTHKIVADANDVLDEITQDGGREMWDRESWDAFEPRLRRWMAIFEETGARHGLRAEGGTILGTAAPGLADFVAFALWFTMTDKLPRLGGLLVDEAPAVAALVHRIAGLPAIAGLRAASDRAYGTTYCGGQIEKSLRAVLD